MNRTLGVSMVAVLMMVPAACWTVLAEDYGALL